MALISVSDELAKKSFTNVENKFITKYMPVLEPIAVKVYLYALYVYQSGLNSASHEDMAKALNISEDELKNYFEYLEEFELVSILSVSPLEVKILDAENVYGTPKKFKPEKYADFTKIVQNTIKGRMISTNEFREYFLLLEDYGFEQNALIMIINYCVNLKGDSIRFQYIKKVAKSFAEEGAVTAKKVDEKLSAYTSSTPALINIFRAAGINKQPDIDDDRLYKKWTAELGFEENAIAAAAKAFKVKNTDKLDSVIMELYKNKKFDVKEIKSYSANKNSIYIATVEIARNLGVYIQNTAPYIDNYVNAWCDYGFEPDCLKQLSVYCFRHNKKTFEDMHELIKKLYSDGIITTDSVNEYIEKVEADDRLIKKLLTHCGLSRKIIDWDRESLARWKSWGFDKIMLTEAAKISAGKANPMAYMNAVLSSWKSDGIFSTDKIIVKAAPASPETKNHRAGGERHESELRHPAHEKDEKQLAKVLSDEVYGKIYKDLNELSIQLAFAEIRNAEEAEKLSAKMKEMQFLSDKRLSELGIARDELIPVYSCKICNDTGYDKNGNPCVCLKKFLSTIK